MAGTAARRQRLDGNATLAPGIAATTTDGDLQPGMQRTCVDEGGRWSETCTIVEPGRSYRMEVDTSTWPWRHRLLLDALAMAALARGAPHEQVLDACVERLEHT